MNDDEEYWRVKAEAWQKTIRAERRIDSAPEVRRDGEIPHDSLQLGILLNQTPALTLTQNDEQLGFNAERGAAARKWLIDRNYCGVRAMARRGQGGQIFCLEPLPPLFAELKFRGLQPFPYLIPRSKWWLHGVAYPLWIKRTLHNIGVHQMWFEKTMADVAFDCVYFQDEKFWAIEICLGAKDAEGIIAYNLKKAEKCSNVDGVAQTFMAFHDSKILKAFTSALKKQSVFIQRCVTAISLGDYAPVESKAKQ